MAINKAVLKAVDILQFIEENKAGVTLSEIAQHLSLPVTSTKDILAALQEKRMIEWQDPRLKTYKIGIKCFEMGSSYAANTNVLEVAIPYINDLSKEIDNTIFLGKLVDERIVYLYKSESTKSSLTPTCKVGSRAHLSTTGQGKVLLAYNQDLYEKIMSRDLLKRTQHSITDKALFATEIAQISQQGYAVDRFEDNDNVMCVAFPVFGSGGVLEHCLSISGTVREEAVLEKEIALGQTYSREISARLGYYVGT